MPPPIPSPEYTTLVLAMKMAKTPAELREWGSENAIVIQKLEPIERQRFTSEYTSWRALLAGKPYRKDYGK